MGIFRINEIVNGESQEKFIQELLHLFAFESEFEECASGEINVRKCGDHTVFFEELYHELISDDVSEVREEFEEIENACAFRSCASNEILQICECDSCASTQLDFVQSLRWESREEAEVEVRFIRFEFREIFRDGSASEISVEFFVS